MVPLEAEKLFRFPHLWGDLEDITAIPTTPQLPTTSRACRPPRPHPGRVPYGGPLPPERARAAI